MKLGIVGLSTNFMYFDVSPYISIKPYTINV